MSWVPGSRRLTTVPAGLLSVMVVLACTVACLAVAEPDSTIPRRPGEPRASKAYGVLEARCARCHQSGLIESGAPVTGFTNVLALDEMARDASLVRPGLPDASALYTTMLRRAMPPEAWRDEAAGKSGPAADEIESIRDWIEGLPEGPSKDCGDRHLIKTEDVAQEMADALRKLPGDAVGRTRFVSLDHLYNACLSTEEISAYRSALVQLLRRLSRKDEPFVAGEVDPKGLILRIDLDRLGWTVADWERAVASYPYRAFYPYDSFDAAVLLESVRRLTATSQPIVRGDWLAYASLKQLFEAPQRPVPTAEVRSETSAPSPSQPLPAPPPPPAIAALARLYERDAGPEVAAAELGVTRADLDARLAALPQDYDTLVRRLRWGLLPRNELINLQAAATDAWEAAPDPTAPVNGTPEASAPLRLSLWADKEIYAPHELVTVSARASSDCNLTLISVNSAGRATVLFPNELEQNNLLKAGVEINVPAATAGYQFRVGERGRETVVGVCTVTRKIAVGIRLDYERQRFTSLGSWRRFLNQSQSDINPVQRTVEAPLPRRRWRILQRKRVEEKLEPLRPEHHARTAILLEVQ